MQATLGVRQATGEDVDRDGDGRTVTSPRLRTVALQRRATAGAVIEA